MKKLFICLVVILFPILANAQEIALITDIHAGKENKLAKKNGTIVYPKRAEKIFKSKIQQIKKNDINLLVVLGDSTQKKDLKRFIRLTRALGGLNTIWVKGNHDGAYWVFQEMQKFDFGDFQVIALDSNSQFSKDVGYLTDEQKNFVLANLDKPTIIAMHHPFYVCAASGVIPSYADFKAALESNGNVIAVISGHCHRSSYHISNGVEYITVEALTWAGSYYIFNTEKQTTEIGEDAPS